MLTRHTSRALLSSSIAPRLGRLAGPSASTRFPSLKPIAQRSSNCRGFHSTPAICKGIQPDSSDPHPPHPQSSNPGGAPSHVSEPSPLSKQRYHEYAEHYLNVVLTEIEDLPEDGPEMEAEYHVSTLCSL